MELTVPNDGHLLMKLHLLRYSSNSRQNETLILFSPDFPTSAISSWAFGMPKEFTVR
jgi:hypothetical protein